jgi:uncharacterized protein YjiK
VIAKSSVLFPLFGALALAQTTVVSLKSYAFTAENVVQYELPKPLREVSGLTVSADGRLFAHNDEAGDIYQIHPANGSIIKKFSLGPRPVLEDFEGIEIVNGFFYLVTSSGTIYECAEGKHNEHVPYTVYETSLTKEYNVEGLCYDPETDCLLLACKGYSGLSRLGSKVVFAFSLASKKLEHAPRFVLSLKHLEALLHDKPYYLSDMAYNIRTKTFLILDSHVKSIIELSSDGTILHAAALQRAIHKQPEGLALLPDGTLVVADEGAKRGTLTLYKRKK